MAQRITRLTTDQKIAGSNPAGIDTFFLFLVLSFFSAPPFYPHCKPDAALAKEIDAKDAAPPGGLEPPTFRLTAERASRLRHGGRVLVHREALKLEYGQAHLCLYGKCKNFPHITPLWSSG